MGEGKDFKIRFANNIKLFMHIKKGDLVAVISGADKGKTGKVLHAFPSENRVIVEGVNKRKHHERPRRSGQKGQIIDKLLPIHVSNVLIVDPQTKMPSRIAKRMVQNRWVRVTKKSGSEI